MYQAIVRVVDSSGACVTDQSKKKPYKPGMRACMVSKQ
jgi:hypothetical protein